MKKLMRKPIGEVTIGQFTVYTLGYSLATGLLGWALSRFIYRNL